MTCILYVICAVYIIDTYFLSILSLSVANTALHHVYICMWYSFVVVTYRMSKKRCKKGYYDENDRKFINFIDL